MMEDILLGVIAGAASRAISSPLNIITLRLQAERAETEDEDAPVQDKLEGNGVRAHEIEQVEQEEGSLVDSYGEVPRSSDNGSKDDMGFFGVVRLIYGEQGWKGFWRGFGTAVLLSINPSITLAFFQLFRSIIVYSRKRRLAASAVDGNVKALNLNLTPWQAFFVGAIANSISNTVLYPLILAKKRLQAGSGAKQPDTLLDVLVDAAKGRHDPYQEQDLETKEEAATVTGKAPPVLERGQEKLLNGVEGLYQGLQMQLLKGFFTQGMTFLVKGRIEQVAVAAYLRQRPSQSGSR